MKDLEPQDPFAERIRKRLDLVQELVRETGVEMARLRASTAALEAMDKNEWERAQRLAHNIAARAQALDLGVLARCARELERFAGAIVAREPGGQTLALQGAAIAIETIDLELGVLSKAEKLT
jgi:HPt (histidine-containing phosphotransfer) domain-containing protein